MVIGTGEYNDSRIGFRIEIFFNEDTEDLDIKYNEINLYLNKCNEPDVLMESVVCYVENESDITDELILKMKDEFYKERLYRIRVHEEKLNESKSRLKYFKNYLREKN